jgi:arylsulfatase A-like enzyme
MGRFLDMAERLGLFEDTLILWTTDHGHLFGEHDLQGKPGAEMGRLYEPTARIPLLVYHPEGWGAGERVPGIVQPPDLLPSILEFMGVGLPSEIDGRSFWPLVRGEGPGRERAFSNRYPQSSNTLGGAAFDGWVGTDRVVEPATVTTEAWSLICAPEGQPSELYDLREDPEQAHNVLAAHGDVADELRTAWLTFMTSHGASEARMRPFQEASVDVRMPPASELYAFRDDQGQWIAFPTEREARAAAYHEDAPGPRREVVAISFGDLLADDPQNLVHLFAQYYWAEDLA